MLIITPLELLRPFDLRYQLQMFRHFQRSTLPNPLSSRQIYSIILSDFAAA